MKKLLCAKNISKSFGENTVFEDINFELHQGEILALIGPSGIGKTTLLNILSGLIKPDSGNVYLDKTDITAKPGHISYMQQKDLLLPYYTVLENVCLPLIIKGVKKKEAKAQVYPLFEKFGLDAYQNKYPDEMSGGMKQRAALMRTYIQSKEIVLLDEPFGALDAVTRRKMQKWYLEISHSLSLSTVIITHDTDEALIMADRVEILSGNPAKIKTSIRIDNKPNDFELTEAFINNKKELLSYLN